MVILKKNNGYWTIERCREEALKYDYLKDFKEKSKSAYTKTIEQKWSNYVCSHLISLKKKSGYWTKERCYDEALKYKTRTEYYMKSSGSYSAAKKNEWLDDVCAHMIPVGNIHKRLVYSYEFSNNYVYIGITCNEERRNSEHLGEQNTTVYKFIKLSNTLPDKKILSNGYVDALDAQNLEKFWVDEYLKNGWNILNIRKTGGLGGNVKKWTKENSRNVALQCKTRTEFSLLCRSAYNASRKNNWLNEFFNVLT